MTTKALRWNLSRGSETRLFYFRGAKTENTGLKEIGIKNRPEDDRPREKLLRKGAGALKGFKCAATITILTGWVFMMCRPPMTYAQTHVAIDRNPIILMDKQVIEIDRRVLRSAQKAGTRDGIKAARQKLQNDIRKLKADIAVLKKNN